jgi:hypothetical protein
LQLNADFVLHKICDLGAVSCCCGLLTIKLSIEAPITFLFFLCGGKNKFEKFKEIFVYVKQKYYLSRIK